MLTVCPTPIGNLGDVSERQLQALREAEIILCEDTRVTGKLLELLGIVRVEGVPRLWRMDDHTEASKLGPVVDAVASGQRVVLVSDAGMPAIADPGFKLIRELAARRLPYDVLPGANAALVALVASGLPLEAFAFVGFLDSKRQARQAEIERWHRVGVTWGCYEAPHRIVEMLTDVQQVCGAAHPVFVGRELTKMHQEYLSGTVAEVTAALAGREKVRGECVVVLGAGMAGEGAAVELTRLVSVLKAADCTPQQIKTIASELLGVSKAEAYAELQAQKGQN